MPQELIKVKMYIILYTVFFGNCRYLVHVPHLLILKTILCYVINNCLVCVPHLLPFSADLSFPTVYNTSSAVC